MRKNKPSLIVDVLTIFPSMFEGPMTESLMGRARKAKIIDIRVHSLRRWSDDARHDKVDDRPYGGGSGMLIKAEPIYRAIKSLGGLKKSKNRARVIFMSPQGAVFSQKKAVRLAQSKHFILICGHYEGIDERLMTYVDEEISIGDYVLTGGEIPALVLMDAVARLVPGVVGEPESLVNESFSSGSLDYPHYTRPRDWRGKKVPEVLLSGHHENIKRWRKKTADAQTRKKRPRLLGKRKF